MPFPKSVPGAVVALVYVLGAIWVIHGERVSTSGGWINLRGMGAILITAPVSLVAEWLGFKLDYRSNVQMGIAVLGTAVLLYLLTAGLVKLGAMLLARLGGQ